jgi:hypothetical protein
LLKLPHRKHIIFELTIAPFYQPKNSTTYNDAELQESATLVCIIMMQNIFSRRNDLAKSSSYDVSYILNKQNHHSFFFAISCIDCFRYTYPFVKEPLHQYSYMNSHHFYVENTKTLTASEIQKWCILQDDIKRSWTKPNWICCFYLFYKP